MIDKPNKVKWTLGIFFQQFCFVFCRKSQVIFGVVIAVIGFVVHDQITINKIKRVRFRFKRISNHLLDSLRIQLGKIIDMFHSVFAVRYAKAKVKIKWFQQFVSKKVTFNHSEILDWLRTYTEIYGSPHFLKPEKNSILFCMFDVIIK